MSTSPIQPTSNNYYYLLPKIDVKKAVRITCVALLFISALGLIFIGFQPIFFASSFNRQNSDSHQLSSQQLQTSDPVTESPRSSLDSAVSRDISPHLSCLQRVESAKERLLQCPAAKDLWDQLEREGGISLECVDDIPAAGSTNAFNRKIYISEVIDHHNTVSLLLFEMNNLKRARQFIRLNKKLCDLSTADEFALKMERLEHYTARDTHRIAFKCIQAGIWPAHMDEYYQYSDPEYPSFLTDDQQARYERLIGHKVNQPWTIEETLKLQDSGGHTQIYRDGWHRICDARKNLQWMVRVESAVLESLQKNRSIIIQPVLWLTEGYWEERDKIEPLFPRDWL